MKNKYQICKAVGIQPQSIYGYLTRFGVEIKEHYTDEEALELYDKFLKLFDKHYRKYQERIAILLGSITKLDEKVKEKI